MTSDLDIYRSANLLVKRHGQDAPIHAAMQADAMLEAGDLDGLAVWRRILTAGSEGVAGDGAGAGGTGALSSLAPGELSSRSKARSRLAIVPTSTSRC